MGQIIEGTATFFGRSLARRTDKIGSTAPEIEVDATCKPISFRTPVTEFLPALLIMTEKAVTTTENPTLEPDLAALLAGDEKAFELLVVNESPRLFRVIYRILGDEEEAQNILQETFLQAFQRMHTFRGESKLTTWLYAIGINLSRASLRKSKRFSSLNDQDVERMLPSFAKGMFAESPATWDPLKLTERKDRHRLLHDAIEQLPEDYKAIVILRDIEEHSTEEVASMLNITGGAVRVRLHRARMALRNMLNPHFQYQKSAAR